MKDESVPLRERTKAFALRVAKMYSSLPKGRIAQTMGYQAFRAGTSVGAQYREACRARSDAEIISKLESTLQELDETSYWLESFILPARAILPRRREQRMLKKSVIVAIALALLAAVAIAAVNTYQVTGPVLAVTNDSITVQKGKDKWELARDPNTKIKGDLKVGSKVTIEYRMIATSVEVAAPAKKK